MHTTDHSMITLKCYHKPRAHGSAAIVAVLWGADRICHSGKEQTEWFRFQIRLFHWCTSILSLTSFPQWNEAMLRSSRWWICLVILLIGYADDIVLLMEFNRPTNRCLIQPKRDLIQSQVWREWAELDTVQAWLEWTETTNAKSKTCKAARLANARPGHPKLTINSSPLTSIANEAIRFFQ